MPAEGAPTGAGAPEEAPEETIPTYQVWKDMTPTGLPLPTMPGSGTPRAPYIVQRYKDQTNSQDWFVTVASTHPSKLDPNAIGFNRAVPRFYEATSALLIPSFRPGQLNTTNVEFLDPNNYLLPHPKRAALQQDRKIGTVLHAVDLVWLKKEDSKVAYDDIAARDMLQHPASVIGSLVPGMWVSRTADPADEDPAQDKRYALLFAFRQFDSASREPLLHCIELSQTDENPDHFLSKERHWYRNIEASEIRAFGNNSNTVNNSLKELMEVALSDELRFIEHYPLGDPGSIATVVEAQNKLTDSVLKREHVNTALREFRADSLRNSKGDQNHYGIRWANSAASYKVAKQENGKYLEEPPAVLEREFAARHQAFDLLIMAHMLAAVDTAHLCYEYDFRPTQSAEDKFIERKASFEQSMLAAEEQFVEVLQEVDWKDGSVKSTYEFLDIVPHPDFNDYWEKVPGAEPEEWNVSSKLRPAFKEMALTQILRAYAIDKVTPANVMIPKYLYEFLKRVFKEWDGEHSPAWYTDPDAKTLSGTDFYEKLDTRTASGFGETGGRLARSAPRRRAADQTLPGGKPAAWNPKDRQVGQVPPTSHYDADLDDVKDGKTAKNRMVGTKARATCEDTTHGRIFIWCVCASSRADKDAKTYPGHWRPSHGPKDIRPSHPDALADGSCADKPKKRLYLTPEPRKPAAKRKAPASKEITDHEIKMRKVMDMGQCVVDSNNKAVRKLNATSLKLSKSEMLLQTTQNALVKEIKKLRKEKKSLKKKSSKALKGVMQHVETFAGLIKQNEPVPLETTVSFFGYLKKANGENEAAEEDNTAGAKVFKKAIAVLKHDGSDSDDDDDDDHIEGTVTFPMDYDDIETPAHYKESTSFVKLNDFEENFSDDDADDDNRSDSESNDDKDSDDNGSDDDRSEEDVDDN